MPYERACQTAREDLINCVIRSDCVLKSGKTPSECIKHSDQLPMQCRHLISSFADCKKGMLDMRRRFRGNHLSDKELRAERGSGGIMGNVEVGVGPGGGGGEAVGRDEGVEGR